MSSCFSFPFRPYARSNTCWRAFFSPLLALWSLRSSYKVFWLSYWTQTTRYTNTLSFDSLGNEKLRVAMLCRQNVFSEILPGFQGKKWSGRTEVLVTNKSCVGEGHSITWDTDVVTFEIPLTAIYTWIWWVRILLLLSVLLLLLAWWLPQVGRH